MLSTQLPPCSGQFWCTLHTYCVQIMAPLAAYAVDDDIYQDLSGRWTKRVMFLEDLKDIGICYECKALLCRSTAGGCTLCPLRGLWLSFPILQAWSAVHCQVQLTNMLATASNDHVCLMLPSWTSPLSSAAASLVYHHD